MKGIVWYLGKADGMEPSQARPADFSLELVVLSVGDCVTQVDEKLSKAAFGRSVVTENVGESCIAKRLWKALSKSLTSPIVVAQPRYALESAMTDAG